MYEMDKYTVSLLHFEDGFKDESGKVWATNGGAEVSAVQSKFGGSSLYLNGSQYLTTPTSADFIFGTGDFTIDMWINCASDRRAVVFSTYDPSLVGFSLQTGLNGAGTITFHYGNTTLIEATNCYIVGVFSHIAIVRSCGILTLYCNGVSRGSVVDSTNIASYGNLVYLGDSPYRSYPFPFTGYIDELHVSKGIARWTSDFDPNKPLEQNPDPTPNPETGKILLTVTLAEEVEREYPVTKAELDAFIKWYDTRANGTGAVYYTFNKFLNRKDYLVFDKILTFQVTDFTK